MTQSNRDSAGSQSSSTNRPLSIKKEAIASSWSDNAEEKIEDEKGVNGKRHKNSIEKLKQELVEEAAWLEAYAGMHGAPEYTRKLFLFESDLTKLMSQVPDDPMIAFYMKKMESWKEVGKKYTKNAVYGILGCLLIIILIFSLISIFA